MPSQHARKAECQTTLCCWIKCLFEIPFPTSVNVLSKEPVYSLNQQGEMSYTVWQG